MTWSVQLPAGRRRFPTLSEAWAFAAETGGALLLSRAAQRAARRRVEALELWMVKHGPMEWKEEDSDAHVH